MERLAIVTISIGDRSWSKYTIPTMRLYAEACEADFFVESSPPSHKAFPLPDLPNSPGRRNKIAYASKSFFPWWYMANYGYDRVLVLDDTCCIRPEAESIFELIPRGFCGISKTTPRHAKISFECIDKLVKNKCIEGVVYNDDNYMNSGVIVYDRSCMEAINPDKIIYASDLLFCRYPHQTLTYYLFALGNVPLFKFPYYFNGLPASWLPSKQRAELDNMLPYLKDVVRIYHVTGKYKKRGLIIRQICEQFFKQV